MAASLSTATVDVTFNAWWKHYGGTPETIQKALEKTKQQIGPPMPPGYVPPPLRSKAPRHRRATASTIGEQDLCVACGLAIRNVAKGAHENPVQLVHSPRPRQPVPCQCLLGQ